MDFIPPNLHGQAPLLSGAEEVAFHSVSMGGQRSVSEREAHHVHLRRSAAILL